MGIIANNWRLALALVALVISLWLLVAAVSDSIRLMAFLSLMYALFAVTSIYRRRRNR